MNIDAYLKRINFSRSVSPDVQTLWGLHYAHMLHIPFENIDIGLKRPIRLDEESLWNKLIVWRRGGFCYELNGIFAKLLENIGFEVTNLNARVYNREGALGIDFDHLALFVRIPGQSGRWLADVGFGDSFHEPLYFDRPEIQEQGQRAYRLEQIQDGYATWQRNYDGSWGKQYFFDLQPHRFPEEYEAACLYHQTSPRSSFTRGSIISRATPDGRVTLEDGRLILTKNGLKTESAVPGRDEYNKLLKRYFEITL